MLLWDRDLKQNKFNKADEDLTISNTFTVNKHMNSWTR